MRVVLGVMALLMAGSLHAQRAVLLDPFDTVGPWSAYASDGITTAIAAAPGETGRALRLDVDYHGGAGYAVIRRPLPLELPANYRFDFRIRSTLPPNTIEVKFLDASGQNVWWSVDRDFAFGNGWRTITVRKREIAFAWGPLGGGPLEQPETLEIAVTAGEGGKGSVWFDELTLTELPKADTTWPPRVRSTRADVGRASVARLVDADTLSSWLVPALREATAIVDFGALREFGGMVLVWSASDAHRPLTIEVSSDRLQWHTAATVAPAPSRRSYVMTGEQDARYVRLTLEAGPEAAALNELELLPVEFGVERTPWVRRMSADARVGLYPRVFSDSLVWWTVLGPDAGAEEALFDEFGRIEVGERAYSVEPFVRRDGRLFTWREAAVMLSPLSGVMPHPFTRLDYGTLALDVEAWTAGTVAAPIIGARYTIHNRDSAPRRHELLLALRPLQVNPPSQFLNIAGGAGRLRSLTWTGNGFVADGRIVRVVSHRPSGGVTDGLGAPVSWYLHADSLPWRNFVDDTLGFAEGLARVVLDIPARSARSVTIALGLAAGEMLIADSAWAVESRERAEEESRALLSDFRLSGNDEVSSLDAAIRSSVGFILVNRDGPRIQPGSRAYARSWIRDAALTSSALLRLGLAAPVRDFLYWFAPYQFASGKVPCCVDRRGADPVPENDSHGELLYLAAEYHRRTGDRAVLDSLWPHLAAAAQYMDSLRHSRLTPAYQADSLRAYHGLLPESISHEGYSARPVHSYWDQLWALRGFRDAAYAAAIVGQADQATHWRAVADSFESDLLASYDATMQLHAIDFLPGSVELGDFDATSTTIAGDPVHLFDRLPRAPLLRTFAILDSLLAERELGRWDAYTPYEARNVGAKVRLGQRTSALRELRSLMNDRRPVEWNQWPEVIFRDARATRFLGDLPHTWVASDVIRSTLDLFAYEGGDGELVLLGGVPTAWLEGHGIEVRIPWQKNGPIRYAARLEGGAVVLDIASLPPGTRWRVSAPDGMPIRFSRQPAGRLASE